MAQDPEQTEQVDAVPNGSRLKTILAVSCTSALVASANLFHDEPLQDVWRLVAPGVGQLLAIAINHGVYRVRETYLGRRMQTYVDNLNKDIEKETDPKRKKKLVDRRDEVEARLHKMTIQSTKLDDN